MDYTKIDPAAVAAEVLTQRWAEVDEARYWRSIEAAKIDTLTQVIEWAKATTGDDAEAARLDNEAKALEKVAAEHAAEEATDAIRSSAIEAKLPRPPRRDDTDRLTRLADELVPAWEREHATHTALAALHRDLGDDDTALVHETAALVCEVALGVAAEQLTKRVAADRPDKPVAIERGR